MLFRSTWSKKGECLTTTTFRHAVLTGIRKARPTNITGRCRAIRDCVMPVTSSSSSVKRYAREEAVLPMALGSGGLADRTAGRTELSRGLLLSGCRMHIAANVQAECILKQQ